MEFEKNLNFFLFFFLFSLRLFVSGELDDDTVEEASGSDPYLDVPILNVTVISGQTAVLPCSIENLGKYKVVWIDPNSIPLTYEEKRVVDDFRFTLVRPVTKEWNLQLTNVSYGDQGPYRCTVNTDPVKIKLVSLFVKIPPKIIDELSSNDQVVREGETVFLICNSTGIPQPEVTWYKKKYNQFSFIKEKLKEKGPMLIINKISRGCQGDYECLVSNGVSNDVTRNIKVNVEFKPEVSVKNERQGQKLGLHTILICTITANPQGLTYWEKGGKKIQTSGKFSIDYYNEDGHNLTSALKVNDLEEGDFGVYKCVGSNALGTHYANTLLYEYKPKKLNNEFGYLGNKNPPPNNHKIFPIRPLNFPSNQNGFLRNQNGVHGKQYGGHRNHNNSYNRNYPLKQSLNRNNYYDYEIASGSSFNSKSYLNKIILCIIIITNYYYYY